jgi:hypothetical protein
MRHYTFCGEEVNSIVCLELQMLRYLLSAFQSLRHIVPPYRLLTKRYKLRYCWLFNAYNYWLGKINQNVRHTTEYVTYVSFSNSIQVYLFDIPE